MQAPIECRDTDTRVAAGSRAADTSLLTNLAAKRQNERDSAHSADSAFRRRAEAIAAPRTITKGREAVVEKDSH